LIEQNPPSYGLLPGGDPVTASIAVLAVADDADSRDSLRARLDAVDDVCLETVTTPTAAPAHVDAVDCVVVDDSLSDEQLGTLLTAVRRREPTLPFVYVASHPDGSVLADLPAAPWTDCLRPPNDAGLTGLLASRIHALVGYQRTVTVANRALAALEQTSDATAVVGPDGTVEFADRLFARHLDATPAGLTGEDWQSLYPDAEVDRLESDVFPTLDDGWRWVGDCEMYWNDDATVVARTRIDALDDGSMVVTVTGRPTPTN
jgi:PAS domain-containing protein